jgi:sugar/nucleoside kinase (ribokinase family)
MADLISLGCMALDEIKTPFGRVSEVLGGPATYFSVAASFFVRPGMVSVIGNDLTDEHLEPLMSRDICMKGLQTLPGKTMRWEAYYEYDMNEAHTVRTDLNTFGSFEPMVPEEYRDARYVFITPSDSRMALKFLKQLNNPKFTAMDTKELWINQDRQGQLEMIRRSNLLLINEWEARQLFDTPNLVQAANKALALGPGFVIIKKGEHGSLLFTRGSHFSAPGYPLENVTDPTGAGDSFAGGLMGWLAKSDDISEPNIRRAMIYGSAIASFNAEAFGLDRLKAITLDDVRKRYDEFMDITTFRK